MREVGSNARGIDDIKEAKLESIHVLAGLQYRVIEATTNLGNLGMCLEEKGQRLADTA